jgi:hypothetical protein
MTAAANAPVAPGHAFRRLGFRALLVLLAAFVLYAGVREVRKSGSEAQPQPQVQAPAQPHAFAEHRPAQTPAEERFSQALWNIHAEVRTAAVRMTFAGLAYKMGDGNATSVQAKVTPLAETFRQAAVDLRSIEGPDSMAGVRSRYAEAVRLYAEASRAMVKVAEDHDDSHLLTAQQMSEQAAGMLLEVGDQLWPGEIKPN